MTKAASRKTLGQLLGRTRSSSAAAPQLFGVEVEVENCPLRLVNQEWLDESGWMYDGDGSLRNNGLEFLFVKPMTLGQSIEAVESLYNDSGVTWETSVRTGIHVHVDFRNKYEEDLIAVCAMYSALEPIIFNKMGILREQNIYCVPWYRSDDDVGILLEAVAEQRRRLRSIGNTCKYSGLYLGPLLRLGSIEFRQAPTFDTSGEMVGWLEFLDCLTSTSLDEAHNAVQTMSADFAGDYVRDEFPYLADSWDEDVFFKYDGLGVAESILRGYSAEKGERAKAEWASPRLARTKKGKGPAKSPQGDPFEVTAEFEQEVPRVTRANVPERHLYFVDRAQADQPEGLYTANDQHNVVWGPAGVVTVDGSRYHSPRVAELARHRELDAERRHEERLRGLEESSPEELGISRDALRLMVRRARENYEAAVERRRRAETALHVFAQTNIVRETGLRTNGDVDDDFNPIEDGF